MDDGATPFFAASHYGHVAVVKLLCDAGANTEQAEDAGATLFISASQECHVAVVKLLCDAGANKDKADNHRSTPLAA